jgi:hypothetical protein
MSDEVYIKRCKREAVVGTIGEFAKVIGLALLIPGVCIGGILLFSYVIQLVLEWLSPTKLLINFIANMLGLIFIGGGLVIIICLIVFSLREMYIKRLSECIEKIKMEKTVSD